MTSTTGVVTSTTGVVTSTTAIFKRFSVGDCLSQSPPKQHWVTWLVICIIKCYLKIRNCQKYELQTFSYTEGHRDNTVGAGNSIQTADVVRQVVED